MLPLCPQKYENCPLPLFHMKIFSFHVFHSFYISFCKYYLHIHMILFFFKYIKIIHFRKTKVMNKKTVDSLLSITTNLWQNYAAMRALYFLRVSCNNSKRVFWDFTSFYKKYSFNIPYNLHLYIWKTSQNQISWCSQL